METGKALTETIVLPDKPASLNQLLTFLAHKISSQVKKLTFLSNKMKQLLNRITLHINW
jgi:hypothetical protein